MKKLKKSAFLFALLTVLVFTFVITSYAAEENVFNYEIVNGEAHIIGGGKIVTEDVIIPAELGGCPVTEITGSVFYRTSAKSVIIPETVKEVSCSFNDSMIESITFPESVEFVSLYGLISTKWIESQPDGMIYVGKVALAYKGEMPDNTTLIIKEGTKYIGCEAFKGQKNLVKVIIPDSVTEIGFEAFYECTNLAEIQFSKNLSSVYDCLTGTKWYNNQPDGLVYAGNIIYTYKGKAPQNTVLEIKEGTLGVSTISQDSLIGVKIPASVKYIDEYSFDRCTRLKYFEVATGNTEYKSVDGVLFSKDGKRLIKYPAVKADEKYVIPDGVETIEGYAFESCGNLENIVFPNSLKVIGGNAFSDCYYLGEVIIPDGVETIEYGAFDNCTSLKKVVIPNSVKAIISIFDGCTELADITFPTSVVAFDDVSSFEELPWYKNQPDGIVYAGKTLYRYKGSAPADTNIIIPSGIKGIADDAFYRKANIKSITIPASVEYIGDNAFDYCSDLEKINVKTSSEHFYSENGVLYDYDQKTLIHFPCKKDVYSFEIPDGVEVIKDTAIMDNENIGSVEIPSTVTYIGYDFLEGCKYLETIEVSDDNKFYTTKDGILFNKDMTDLIISPPYNDKISNYTIPSTVKNISFAAFENSKYLTSITIPGSIDYVTGFSDCAYLESVTIQEGVTEIGYESFDRCSALEYFYIPLSVTYISDTFYNCSSLDEVVYAGTPSSWMSIEGYEGVSDYYDVEYEYSYHTHNYSLVSTVSPSCMRVGVKTYKCSCGDSYEKYTAATNHPTATYDAGKAPTTTAIGYTEGKYCPVCKIWISGHREIPKLVDVHTHSYTWNVTKAATCTLTGIKTFTCSCGKTYTETIPATNHANATTDAGKAPTTTEVGYTSGKYCPDCKIWIEGHTEIPRLPEEHKHSYTSSVTKTATCTETGTKTFTCTCGDTYTESIPATNHPNATTDAGKEPTETEVGYTAGKYCPDCETWLEGHIEIPKLEAHVHSYTSTITTEPTCTTAGTKTYTCTCGDTYTETIPATNHANATTDAGKEPTTTEVGYTAGKYCPDCKTWLEGHEEIPMLHTHTYTSTITKEATCWREGEKTYTCTCGDSYTEAIAKLDHEYRPWETKKNPTCTAPGLEWSYCLLCDNDFEREIPATGHTIIDYTRRATPDSDGAYVTACDVCNDVFKSISFGRPTEYKLSTAKYTYDGKTKTPKLTVETSDGVVLKEGVDYELELPSGRKAVGVYTYRVVFKGNFLGEKKVSYQILPGKTTSVSATQSTDSIKLTWKKVTGATGYRVYQYNSSTGKYKTLKTLTGTSYTVKNLKAGTTYKFAVKAYSKADGETLWAASYKTITTATKPATPTVKATASSDKVTLKWSKVAGATGYVIYMQDDFGDYNKIGSTKNTSYSIKNLGYGETCRFRVVAYKKVDGKNIYGGYKTVKITVPYPAIYVTPSGKRYHYDKECAGKNATKTTLANAKKTRTPCKTCVL